MSKHILLVDADDRSRRMLEVGLQGEGFRVSGAAGAR